MIKRLEKTDPESWELYPKLEARVRNFATRFEITCPIEPILLEMQQRWITAPDLAGYFVSVQNGELDAHTVMWIQNHYGVNKVYVYQTESDQNLTANLEYFSGLESLWQKWITHLNSQVEPKLQVHKMEHCTVHPPAVWIKYFKSKGYSTVVTRHIMELPIFPDLPQQPKSDII